MAGADGENRTIAAWVHVPRGITHLVARFELPVAMAELIIEPSARTHPTTGAYDGKEWKRPAPAHRSISPSAWSTGP